MGVYIGSIGDKSKINLSNAKIGFNVHYNSNNPYNDFGTIVPTGENELKSGYCKEGGYCFFDGILSPVFDVRIVKEYTIYQTHNGYIAQKDNYTAHGDSIKEAIRDVEFKIVQEKVSK